MSDPNLPFAPPSTPPPLPQAAPVWQAPRRKRSWLPWVISISVLLVITLLVAALGGIVNSLSARFSFEGDPLVEGQSGLPFPRVELTCESACFDEADIEATVLSETTLDALGLTQHDFPWGTYDPTTADERHRALTANWAANDGSPNQCVFVIGDTPAVVNLVSDDGVLDPIEYTGQHASSDITSTLEQSVRVFSDDSAAWYHMEHLWYQIDACTEITMGAGSEVYTAIVTPAPALELPDDISVLGWVRTGDPGVRWRAYVFEMRRGNLVVRTRLMTDGSISEEAFRTFIEDYALQLEAIEPNVP